MSSESHMNNLKSYKIADSRLRCINVMQSLFLLILFQILSNSNYGVNSVCIIVIKMLYVIYLTI